MENEKVILVTRKTRLEGLVERFNTVGQAKFYLEHSGEDFEAYQREHDVYRAAVDRLRSDLRQAAKLHEIERGFLPNFLLAPEDIVVTVGIDGLVVNTAKYLDGQPLVAVNPDPARIDGILLPFTVEEALPAVRGLMRDQMPVRHIRMAEARLNDGQTLLAFNDLFIGARSHVSAHYLIEAEGKQERHSSSGIIVSTGAGSTGWLSSMFNMANGIVHRFGSAEESEQESAEALHLAWEADELVFVVREPFISKTSGAGLVCGFVTAAAPLVVHSEMPEGGVIFSDGVETDYLAFNAGMIATIGLSSRRTRLVMPI